MMRGTGRVSLWAWCIAMQACSSPGPPVLQVVRIQTPGCAAARCELSNDQGTWPLARAPGSVEVRVSGEPLRVKCQADDAPSAITDATASRPSTSGVGGVVGGVAGGAAVGMAVGSAALAFIPPLGALAVLGGAATGGVVGNAAERRSRPVRYPSLISLPMVCAATDGKPPALGLTVRGLTREEAKALGLGERTAAQIVDVAAEGLAAASGLRSGDILLALDGLDLLDAADLEERLLSLPPKAPVALRVGRDGRQLDLVLIRAARVRP